MTRRFPVTGGLALLAALFFVRGSAAPPGADLSPAVRDAFSEARALGLYRAPREPRLAPGLAARMDAAPDAPVRVWVFLTDKGIGTSTAYEAARYAFAARLDERTRARRQRAAPGSAADFTDLAVYAPYVTALSEQGLDVGRASRWLNAVSGTVPARSLPALARLPFVRYVQPMLVRRGGNEPDPGPAPGDAAPRGEGPLRSWGSGAFLDSLEAMFYGPSLDQLEQIGVLDLHRLGYSGAGVRVLILDTGFRDEHPAFERAQVVAEWDFVNDDPETGNEAGDWSTQDYHGTGVWGTLGGYGPGELIGPAFAAEFLLAKTEDVPNEVRSEEDDYVAALEWADTLGVDVTSASLSYFTFDDSSGYTYEDLDGDTAVITRAVDLAAAKGILCVNAMGNSGSAPGTLGSPADADSVVAVGAVDDMGLIAGFSSRGPTADDRIKPEVVARGVSTRWAHAWTGAYGTASGTSLSTPLIGGLAALLKEAHPEWSGPEIREALINTASQPLSPDNDYGYGLADGPAALGAFGQSALPISPPRMSLPFALLDPPDGALMGTVLPVLRWSASAAPQAGQDPVYRVLLSGDAAFTDPDTVVVSDTTYTFAIALPPGSEHWWTVEAVVPAGFARPAWNTCSFAIDTAVTAPPPAAPLPAVALGPPLPNPGRGPVRFSVRLPAGVRGTLDLVAVSGRLVRRYEVTGTGGDLELVWDGRGETARPVSAGLYFARLAGGGTLVTRKLVRLE